MASKTVTKRALNQAKLKKNSKYYYQLVQILDNLSKNQALTPISKKEVASFYKSIIKARANFSVTRATNFKFGVYDLKFKQYDTKFSKSYRHKSYRCRFNH